MLFCYRNCIYTTYSQLIETNKHTSSIIKIAKNSNIIFFCIVFRPEAINLLSDLAYRKHTPDESIQSSVRSTTTMPRRLKRGTKSNSSGHSLQTTDTEGANSKCELF